MWNINELIYKTEIGSQTKKTYSGGSSLVVQWLRLHTPNAGDPGSILDQGIRSHMLQLRVLKLQLKILYATMKTEDTQCHS